jgi:2-oxoisovalerate dehydrogenase E1 component
LAQRQLAPGKCLLPSDAVSYVSMGDGSVNNSHFLSALNMAKYASHRKMKCPVIFGISDNGKCISLKGHGYIDDFVRKSGIESFIADGTDVCDVFSKSKRAVDFSRTLYKPSLLLFKNLPRRFGHAATDRQIAYMSADEIASEADKNPLMNACTLAINSGVMTSEEIVSMVESYINVVEKAFDNAAEEPKISSVDLLIQNNSQPIAPTSPPRHPISVDVRLPFAKVKNSSTGISSGHRDAMRKQMTKVFDEILANHKDVVYIGEDVEHGGYYLVTERLAEKYPNRVRDFPPDETSIVGAGMGFSQLGLVPIVEIPYAKYLDCAADMFYEAVFMNWLSDGKQPNGMVVRLQGFDKGVFGGNFHTHNMLTIPPGLDVVVYSNGRDYVRGMRHAVKQARNGRVVMSVDSTDLLNRRHLYEKDDIMLNTYPDKAEDDLTFDDIIVYGRHTDSEFGTAKSKKKCTAVVSYGNGVPTSLAAMDELCGKHGLTPDEVIVIDCPYISSPPQKLRDLLTGKLLLTMNITGVVFADVCKDGPGMPLSNLATKLQNEGVLNNTKWRAIGAANTYNPLSRTMTFLNSADIVHSVLSLRKK